MAARRSAVAPALVAGVIGVLSVVTLALSWRIGGGLSAFLAENQANTWAAGLSTGLVGALVMRSQPSNRIGWLFAGAGLSAAVSAAASAYATYTIDTSPGALPAPDLAALCATVLWLPAFLSLVGGVPLLFPDGRLASPRWRWPARLALGGGVVATVALATTEYIVDDGYPTATNPIDLPWPDGPNLALGTVGFFTVVAVGVAATVGIAVRMRRVAEPARQQYAWYVASVCLVLLSTFLPLPDAMGFAGNLCSVVALGVGIVRYRLFDIESVLSRAVVYALLTAGAILAYVLAVAALGSRLDSGVGPAVVAAVAALILASGRNRLQHSVDRLLYGERRDPLAALTTLGDRLGAVLDTDAVLPAVVETVQQTLRLPYAAVQLAGDDSPVSVSGTLPPRGSTAEFALDHAGEHVGVLVVGLRRGETEVSPADARLLDAFARQVGVAAHGVRVTRDLRRSRERLVNAREEERRRLRRDLHDGLGPALAGITLGLETAGRAAEREGSSSAELLASIRAETSACVDEVRRIVADLRPPALDEIGLLAALERHADLLNTRSEGELRVRVDDAGRRLPPLPAAVEVAAYRIALEAVTNAARHSGAQSCSVSVTLNGDLQVRVVDDGSGLPPARQGVGLASMRERAEELGGTCVVTFREGTGTTVEAVLPVGVS